jgi:hypothetical protein
MGLLLHTSKCLDMCMVMCRGRTPGAPITGVCRRVCPGITVPLYHHTTPSLLHWHGGACGPEAVADSRGARA